MTKPNILYIHSHDTGRYIQPYGYAIPTPNLQRLAEGGVLFRQAFCAAPTCSPSRAALLTGQCPHQAGMLGLANRGFYMGQMTHHIIHTLKPAGYTTVLAGLQHIARDKADIGYHLIMQGKALEFLKSSPSQPFFLDVGFGETHRGSDPAGGYFNKPGPAGDPRYVQPPAPFSDTPQTRQDMADFIVAAARLDQKMGEVFDALAAAGLADNTLVICTTDHGLPYPAMKCNLTDHGIGVMLIMRGPEFTGGKAIDAIVSHIDLFPTICELAGIEQPPWLEGRSLLPPVRAEAQDVNEEVFAEVTYHGAYEPMRAIRTKRWKYIRRFTDRNRPVLVHCDASLTKTLWMEHGWRQRMVDQEELYDLIFDPSEANNIAGDPSAAEVLAEMRERLDAWMRRTDDPVLKGEIPPPSGAKINDADALSHAEPLTVIP